MVRNDRVEELEGMVHKIINEKIKDQKVKNDRIEELEGMVHKIINEKIQDEKVKNDRIAELQGMVQKMSAQIEAKITNMHKLSRSCTLKSAALRKAEYFEQNAQQPLEKPVNVQTDEDTQDQTHFYNQMLLKLTWNPLALVNLNRYNLCTVLKWPSGN